MPCVLDRDHVGAFCRHTHVEAAGARDGPLAGIAFGAKDVFDVAGHRTGFGSPDWLRTHEPATQTAPAIERLLAAGASLAGKTQTDELAFSLDGENEHYGTPVNPAAPGRIPGGSSSGSAAAVAAGLVGLAIGTDTGGSVRLPASFCGVLGIRTTHGRVPSRGAAPLAPSFDTVGWFARDPGVFERAGAVLLDGHAPGRRPRRVLVAEDAFERADPGAAEALRGAVERVARIVGRVETIRVSAEGLEAWAEDFRVAQGAEIHETHGAWIERVRPAVGPGTRERLAWCVTLDRRAVGEARERRERIANRLVGLLADGAVLVLPTTPGAAPMRGLPLDARLEHRARAMQLLCIAGLGRLPQVSVPAALLDGCPLGLSISAAPGGDEMLIGMAVQIARISRARGHGAATRRGSPS
jgi:amidase